MIRALSEHKDNRIAVVILNYRSYRDCQNSIDSVMRKLNAYVFLVDNSEDIAEETKLKMLFGDKSSIHLIFPRKNLGFAGGVNLALRQAVASGFARFFLLNNDAILINNAQHVLNEAFEKYPMSLIAPTIIWGNTLSKGNYYHKYLGLLVGNRPKNTLGWFYYLTGCALAFDKHLLEKVGYLNESFFMYGEDIEYSYRTTSSGLPLILIDEEIVVHKGSQSAKMASFFYEYHLVYSHFLLCFLLFKNPLEKTTAFLCKTAVLMIRAFARCLRYRSLVPLMALLLGPIPLKIRPKKSHL
jgi:N-acetylglucosaminyl-diphospho-decaprenol L-rhamnosyltransferase